MPQFYNIPNFDIKFNIAFQTKQSKGFLAYEYNPIQNLRINARWKSPLVFI